MPMLPGHEPLPPALERAARLLREDVVPRDSWRRQVLDAATLVAHGKSAANGNGSGHSRPPARSSWSMRPLAALAAGVACALVGSLATLAVMSAREAGSPAPVAVAPSAEGAPPLVRFTVDAPAATSVQLVGDFNGWDPAALPLRRSADGRTWEVEVPLTPGRYSYSFLIDGTLAADPRAARAADDDFGSPNSVVLVTGT